MRKNRPRRFLQPFRSPFRALAPASLALGEPFVGVPCRLGPLFWSPRPPRIPPRPPLDLTTRT